MKISKRELLYFIPIVAVFYILPLLANDTGLLIVNLLGITPVICFLSSMIYAINKESNILYPIICTILYIPTIFVYYNESASIYTVIYGIILFVSYMLGKLIRKGLKM